MEDENNILLKLNNSGLRLSNLEKMSFEEIQKFLINQEMYNNVSVFLKQINSEMNPEYFLTAIAMKFNMKQMVNDSDSSQNSEIFKQIEIMVTMYDDLFDYKKESLDIFKVILERFNNKFTEWKEADLYNVIEEYAKMFWSLEIHKKVEGITNEQLSEISSQQEKIKDTVIQIGGNNALDIFNNFSPVMIDEFSLETIKNQVKETYEKAFWDNLRHDIENKTYSSFISILGEIKERIANLTPNRADMHKLLDEYIDIELLSQMLKHNVADDTYFFKLSHYIIERLKELEAPVDNESTKKWQNEIDEIFKKKIIFIDYFPNFFKKVFIKLEKIENETKEFKKTEIYQELVKQKENI